MTQSEKKSTRYADAIAKVLGVIAGLIILNLFTGCASFKLSTMYHDPLYGPHEVALEVPSDVKIDTLSYSQLRWKLRTDSRFRWDFAQYAMDQPYSWYTSNYSFSYWRPYTAFDVYWNRYQFWNDWAFNYPFFNYGWGYNNWGWNNWNYGWAWNWHRPYRPWNNWYNGPWGNPGYNVIWNSSRENTNIAYVRGGRGSRFIDNGNSNIENLISTRYNKPRNNVNNNNNNNNNVIDNIVDRLRDRFNDVRVYNNPNNVPNNNVIRYNNGRPVVPINNNNNNSRPVNNWNNTINSRPSIPNINNSSNSFSRGSSNNFSRGSSSGVSSGGSSRGSSGGVSSGGSSGGSSRGGGKIN